MGLPVANVSILRLPEPVLVIERFDRRPSKSNSGRIEKLHIIDGCQLTDTPLSGKYERNLGSDRDVREVREGVSFEKLFDATRRFGASKAAVQQALLRWALYCLLIGNSDAHGKNFSFFMTRAGVEAAPSYDFVCVLVYENIDHELAMGFGDEFDIDEVKAFALADFAKRIRVPKTLVSRELQRISRAVLDSLAAGIPSDVYDGAERDFVARIAESCRHRADRFMKLAREVPKIRSDLL